LRFALALVLNATAHAPVAQSDRASVYETEGRWFESSRARSLCPGSASLRDTARAMSQENVEVVRAAFEAWNQGDLDAWLETFDPEVEWHTSGAFLGFETAYYGHDGVRNFWQQFREGWEEISLDIEEIIDRGEQVIVLFWFRAKGRDGIEVQRRHAICHTVRGGRVVEAANFAGWEQALESVRLSE
jgi:uncharacterized protein